jgi:protein-tyrosine phosphatase
MVENGRIGVLFVCLGNICRSPLAEAVFLGLVKEAGLGGRVEVDSAGTSNYHTGDAPDPRTIEVARRRGIVLEHRARQIAAEDLDRFEYVVVMDAQNRERVQRLADQAKPGTEVHLLRRFDDSADAEDEVPDPYFGGPGSFEEVQEIVERACRGLLEHIRGVHGL